MAKLITHFLPCECNQSPTDLDTFYQKMTLPSLSSERDELDHPFKLGEVQEAISCMQLSRGVVCVCMCVSQVLIGAASPTHLQPGD